MKNNNLSILLAATIFLFVSCTKKRDAPSVSDNILNYTINEIPVTTDYNVGAFYYNFTTFNPSISQVPSVGKY